MKNLFAINFAENAIVATKTTLKKASVPNSPECKALMKLMKQNPTFVVVEKEIKRPNGKKTYAGLTKAFIIEYISIKENADTLKLELEEVTKKGTFPLVRRWFLDTFNDFDMANAKEEIKAFKIEAAHESVKTSALSLIA